MLTSTGPAIMPARFLSAALIAAAAAGGARAEGPKPEFSIGAIADCQYAAEPDAPPRLYHTAPGKLAAAIDDFNGQPLAFVVQLGDFIDRDWQSFDTLLPIAAKLRHPWHFVLGNHDFAVDDAYKPQVPAKLSMPARYYSFVQHGWMFIVTDGNGLSSYAWPQGSAELAHSMAVHASLYPDKPLWDGGIDDAQMDWLDRTLAEADRRKLKVMLFSHFPVWPENPHNLWNAPAVMALLDRHPSVKIWLDGHNHEGNYGMRGGIHYLNLKAMLDTPETAYARLDFYRDRVVVHGFGRQASMTLPISGEPRKE
jgi:manganese-dependent ADP-ribose/CDP-alcohol diphosphatase